MGNKFTKSKIQDDTVPKTKSSFLTKSFFFKRLCRWAFKKIDTDKNGTVDKKELYSGLLLIHLNLSKYCGAAACKPMKKEQVDKVFDDMDTDNSGFLSEEEFVKAMVILCSDIASRVALLTGVALFNVPIVADFLETHLPTIHAFTTWEMPPVLKSCIHLVAKFVPAKVLEKLPHAVVNGIVGGLFVPFALSKIDDLFEGIANKKKTKQQ